MPSPPRGTTAGDRAAGRVDVDGALKAGHARPEGGVAVGLCRSRCGSGRDARPICFRRALRSSPPRPRRRCRCACWPARSFRATSRPAARSVGASRRSPSPAASRTAPTRSGAAAFPRDRARGRAPIPSRRSRGPGRRGCSQRQRTAAAGAAGVRLRAGQGGACRAQDVRAHAQDEPPRDLLGGEWRSACAHAVERPGARQAPGERHRARDLGAGAGGAQHRAARCRHRLLGRQVCLLVHPAARSSMPS